MKVLKPMMMSGALLVAAPVYGTGYTMSPDSLMQLQVSELGPTRFEMTNQKITDVFFYPEEAAKVVLHPSGSLFVVPLEGQKHVYVTVVGESGDTQDLRLRFVFKQPVPVRLISTQKSKIQDNSKQLKTNGEQS